MSDSNLSEKLVEKVTEGITNIIKKTIIFEKSEKMKGLFIGLAISSSIFGLFTLYNSYQLMNIDEKVNSIEKVVIDNAHMPRVYYKILSEDYSIFYKMSRELIDTNQRIDSVNERIDKIIALLEDNKDEKVNM
jgi:hypothetical protein